MKMNRLKEGCLFLMAVLLIDVSGIKISQNMATKVVNDNTFMVACRDEEGLAVTWHSPKGAILGPKSRPKAVAGTFGYAILFNSPHKVEDSGNYTCSTSKDKKLFELFVEPPLQFTDTAGNQTAVEGAKEFVLKCEVTRGTVTWTLEGGDIITPSKKYKVIADGLVIRNVTRYDSKTYICKGVQQRTGTVLDRKIHFHVKHKPVHPNHPKKHMRQDVVYGYINGSVNLTCLAVANPPAEFEWKVNDKKAKIGHIINESPEVSILQLHIDNKSSFGNYKCIARNRFGSYEENFTLKEGMKPGTPSTVALKETESEKAIFEILGPTQTLDLDQSTKGFRIQYRKIEENEWKNAEFNITNSNLYTLEGLESNSEYEMQAATRNAAGLSDYFPVKSWKTSAGVAKATLPLVYFFVIVFGGFFTSW